MRTTLFAGLAAVAVQNVAAHATFQQLWVDGVDMGSQCARVPPSNSPVEDVTSQNMRCNAGTSPVSKKCGVKAGSTVTIEMHQQPNDRSCGSEAIGGSHYGPVMAYLAKVSDSSSGTPSGGFFKIFQDSYAKKAGSANGDADYWGTKDLNACCGRMSFKIPSDIAAGDYILRAEAVALHTAASLKGAQFYMTCYQLQITGGGSASPAGVSIPGAYSAQDPGILVNIHGAMNGYTAPGPAVYSGGSTKVAGSACTGCESTCKPGSGPSGTAISGPEPTSSDPGSGNGGNGCEVAKWQQCGGTGYTGCTKCASGSTCSAVSPPHYSQCV